MVSINQNYMDYHNNNIELLTNNTTVSVGDYMLDLGIKKRGKDITEDYEVKYLNELVPLEQISGKIYIGDIKKREVKKKEIDEFYVIITDDETQIKWICGFITSYYPETGTIYGEKGGRVYTFIDSLNHIVNNTRKKFRDSYSVDFETFRKSVNDNIVHITVKAVPPTNPSAKAVNLEAISVQLKDRPEILRASTLIDITDEYPQLRMAVTNLIDRKEKVTPENIATELKSLFEKGNIKEREYKHGLKELDIMKKGG